MTQPTPAQLADQLATTGQHLGAAVADLATVHDALVTVSGLARMAHQLPNVMHGMETFLDDQVSAGHVNRDHHSAAATASLRSAYNAAEKLHAALSEASSALEDLT
jgi:hypothetical protein